MADIALRAEALISAVVDQQTNEVVLTFKSVRGAARRVRLHPGIIGSLVVALIGTSQKIAPASSGSFRQVMNCTGIQPAMSEGHPVLDLLLEDTLHFPITFPASAIPAFQAAFATLAELTRSLPPDAPPRKTH